MKELKTLAMSLAIAVLALMAAGLHTALAANATTTNSTSGVNATVSYAGNLTAPAANVTQTANATVVYVTTPSGTIHLVYVSNGTHLVINYNKNVITVNLKTVVYNATTAYYIHVVGHAIGAFNSTYVSQILSQIANALKSGNTTTALSLLKQLGGYIASSNATKKAEVNIMVTAKSLNATRPNATYLKAKVEYEVDKKLAALNGTRNELEVKAFAGNMSQLASFLMSVSKELQPYDPATAAELAKAAAYLANITTTIKELEVKLANGTSIEVHKTGRGYKIEVQIGGEEHGDHQKAKGVGDNKGVGQDREDKGVGQAGKGKPSSGDDKAGGKGGDKKRSGGGEDNAVNKQGSGESGQED